MANEEIKTLLFSILSNDVFKVNKRHATVRFMFFNREDIEWFKPIELRTKQGRRGHIKVCSYSYSYCYQSFKKMALLI